MNQCTSWKTNHFLLNDIHQKIENIRPLDCFLNILLLQRPALMMLRKGPASQCQFQNEQFARLGKQYWRFGRNHAHVLVGFHNALDASERQIVVGLEILFRARGRELLDQMELFGPELGQRGVEFCEELGRCGRWGRVVTIVRVHGSH